LAEHLSLCLSEIDEIEGVQRKCTLSHGFRPDLGISTNAASHVRRRWVFNIDLEDFFPSINFGRVRGYFIKNRHFGLDVASATILAQICCWRNELPQGAPTSPVVSNLLASPLDIALNRLARRERCTYTRYADDITFSTNKKSFPIAIAGPSQGSNGLWEVGDDLRYRIFRCGFYINVRKTRMQHYWSRQEVTGLTVNAKVNIPNDYLKVVRSRVEHLISGKGAFSESSGAKFPLNDGQVQGMLAHIFKIKAEELEYKRPKDKAAMPAFLRTHQKFLDFIHFASSDRPTLVCEGKTDNAYLRLSLRAHDKVYPKLISNDGSKELLIRLFRQTRISRVAQGIGGGAGDLANLIRFYEERMNATKVKVPASPVVVIVDNDDGPRGKGGVFSAVKQVSGAGTVDGTEKFYHVCSNLYLVPTPLLAGGAHSMIESFLAPAVLSTKVGGKELHLDEKTFDKTKHIGKELFVKHVVQRNAATIDFLGYKPILDVITEVIADYEKKKP
jgi:RNA-directed DNA polymerase